MITDEQVDEMIEKLRRAFGLEEKPSLGIVDPVEVCAVDLKIRPENTDNKASPP